MLLQQAVEKYLKGFLLAKESKARRTHDLLELLDDAIPFLPELASFEAVCIRLTEYYTEQRYPPPLVASVITREEVLHSLAEAQELITILKNHVDLRPSHR